MLKVCWISSLCCSKVLLDKIFLLTTNRNVATSGWSHRRWCHSHRHDRWYRAATHSVLFYQLSFLCHLWRKDTTFVRIKPILCRKICFEVKILDLKQFNNWLWISNIWKWNHFVVKIIDRKIIPSWLWIIRIRNFDIKKFDIKNQGEGEVVNDLRSKFSTASFIVT